MQNVVRYNAKFVCILVKAQDVKEGPPSLLHSSTTHTVSHITHPAMHSFIFSACGVTWGKNLRSIYVSTSPEASNIKVLTRIDVHDIFQVRKKTKVVYKTIAKNEKCLSHV